MSDYKDAFTSEYVEKSVTTPTKKSPSTPEIAKSPIDDAKYELNKPKKITIKALISHDKD